MKLDVTLLIILGMATLAVSFCPKCVSSLKDKLNLYFPHLRPPNKTSVVSTLPKPKSFEMGIHNRNRRCIGLFDWLFDYFDEETTSAPSTTKPTTSSASTASAAGSPANTATNLPFSPASTLSPEAKPPADVEPTVPPPVGP